MPQVPGAGVHLTSAIKAAFGSGTSEDGGRRRKKRACEEDLTAQVHSLPPLPF